MLDQRIADGRLERADIETLANFLADFYARTPPEADEAYLDHLAREQPINRSVLELPELGFRETALPLLDGLDRAIKALRPALEARIAAGCMVEGHGDLRPEHVCLNDSPQIIDGLEFNRRMRIIDPFDEVNYLGLECEMEGAAWIRPVLLEMLAGRIDQRPEPAVMALYGTFRMLLRARLSAAHLLEDHIRKPDKWAPQTFRYLALAEREAVNLPYRADQIAIRSPAGT
jgi:aminoglycoside phosphotransferase family enzyme